MTSRNRHTYLSKASLAAALKLDYNTITKLLTDYPRRHIAYIGSRKLYSLETVLKLLKKPC